MMKQTFDLNTLDPESTKLKIITEAARMFALRGYATVSMREIAAAAGITPGTIYAHFVSKQEILELMMAQCERELLTLYRRLEVAAHQARDLNGLVESLSIEQEATVSCFAHYCLWCAMGNQFEFDSARHVFFDVFLNRGRQVMKSVLDTAVTRGLAAPFDTDALAALLCARSVTLLGIEAGRHNGFYDDFDTELWSAAQVTQFLQPADSPESVPVGG